MIYKHVDSIDHISDHLTLLLHLNCNINYSIETESIYISNALWSRADETQIKINIYIYIVYFILTRYTIYIFLNRSHFN